MCKPFFFLLLDSVFGSALLSAVLLAVCELLLV